VQAEPGPGVCPLGIQPAFCRRDDFFGKSGRYYGLTPLPPIMHRSS
jgi:hypothetical protein